MSYVNESYVGMLSIDSAAVLTPEVLTAAVAVHGNHVVGKQLKIKRIGFYVTVAVLAGTAAPAVRFLRRPTYGSSTSQVVLGTLTIPSGSAIGSVIYKEINPVVMFPGDALALDHSVQATDPGTATGQGIYLFEFEEDPEVPANQSRMIASV